MTKEKLTSLRKALKEASLDGFLIPRADAWPGEFVSESAERLAWISGFTGSNGTGIVLHDKAVVLTDGRYALQVKKQVDAKIWDTEDIALTSIGSWLAEYASPHAKIGYDSALYTKTDILKIKEYLFASNIQLVPLTDNPIDILWSDRPSFPDEPVMLFPDELAGNSSREKRKKLSTHIKTKGGQAAFMTSPDSIAWLLNIRGKDTPHTPVPLSYGLLNEDGSFVWFISKRKIPELVRQRLGAEVEIRSPSLLEKTLREIRCTLLLDEEITPVKFIHILEEEGVKYIAHKDIALWPKAIKNNTEQAAIRQAHLVDAKALIHFHEWIKKSDKKNIRDELSIEEHLNSLRQTQPGFIQNSFNPIIGWNENGAIIHYRATQASTQIINGDGLLLVDSGGQYLADDFAGTTDVTRTYAIGTPTKEQIFHYTLVLKSHLAVAMARFPFGTRGWQIDTMSRHIFWQHGLDFPHGLGHGVGHFLNVHEKAIRLSSIRDEGQYILKPGMLLSNEPGLYFEGKYGIRIENLVFVQETGEKDNLGRDILCFETITFAPYDEDLIDSDLLTEKEKIWLDNYTYKACKLA